MMDNLLRVVALASVAAAETAALYGAAAPATLLPRYRRGWDYCTANLCGGADRLGALLNVGNLRELGPEGADKIRDSVRAYGVVVIKNQNLTRAEQVKFTGLLGEPVALAKVFTGKTRSRISLRSCASQISGRMALGRALLINSATTGTRTASFGTRRSTTCGSCTPSGNRRRGGFAFWISTRRAARGRRDDLERAAKAIVHAIGPAKSKTSEAATRKTSPCSQGWLSTPCWPITTWIPARCCTWDRRT